MNLEHSILLDAFRRNKLGKVAGGEVHHVSRLLIDIGEKSDLINFRSHKFTYMVLGEVSFDDLCTDTDNLQAFAQICDFLLVFKLKTH